MVKKSHLYTGWKPIQIGNTPYKIKDFWLKWLQRYSILHRLTIEEEATQYQINNEIKRLKDTVKMYETEAVSRHVKTFTR